MKLKFFIYFCILIVFFSGCVEKPLNTLNGTDTKNTKNITESAKNITVKAGDKVYVNYITYINGKIIDTTYENVAKENNILIPNRTYIPSYFIVGKGKVIEGLEEGIIGMKVGETKNLTVPPEKAYGKVNSNMTLIIPIIQKISTERTITKDFTIPFEEFDTRFGPHKIGDDIKVPYSNIDMTILEINDTHIKVTYNLAVGDKITGLAPWNETVIKVDNKITVKAIDLKIGDVIQLKEFPWNSTIMEIDSGNMTLKHNAIPDTKMMTSAGFVRIHFNDTYITLDRNSKYAGDTLLLNVTLVSIN